MSSPNCYISWRIQFFLRQDLRCLNIELHFLQSYLGCTTDVFCVFTWICEGYIPSRPLLRFEWDECLGISKFWYSWRHCLNLWGVRSFMVMILANIFVLSVTMVVSADWWCCGQCLPSREGQSDPTAVKVAASLPISVHLEQNNFAHVF